MEIERLENALDTLENRVCNVCNDEAGLSNKACNECPVFISKQCIEIVLDAKMEAEKRKDARWRD